MAGPELIINNTEFECLFIIGKLYGFAQNTSHGKNFADTHYFKFAQNLFTETPTKYVTSFMADLM